MKTRLSLSGVFKPRIFAALLGTVQFCLLGRCLEQLSKKNYGSVQTYFILLCRISSNIKFSVI